MTRALDHIENTAYDSALIRTSLGNVTIEALQACCDCSVGLSHPVMDSDNTALDAAMTHSTGEAGAEPTSSHEQRNASEYVSGSTGRASGREERVRRGQAGSARCQGRQRRGQAGSARCQGRVMVARAHLAWRG